MSKHTATPWTRGYTLITKHTSKWSEDKIRQNDIEEGRHIFSNMSNTDEGRGRIHICEMDKYNPDSSKNAAHIVHCVNNFDALVGALENIAAMDKWQPADYIKDHEFAITLIQTMLKQAEAALKAAKGV